MYEVEDRHWWFSAKRRIIRDLLRRFCVRRGDAPLRIADVGCGCGRNLEELPEGFVGIGIDASPVAIDFCRKRGVDACLAMLPNDVPLEPGSFDAVIMADVLEHIDDDSGAAAAAVRLLAPGGVLIATVPALPSLWTSWDEIHGHKRRYTKATLEKALACDGMTRALLSYYNTFLFPPAVAARIMRRVMGDRGATELKVPHAWVNAALERIFASERHLLGRVPLPIGLSLVAVMRKA